MARPDPFDLKHIRNVEAYAKKIDQLYSTAIGKLAQIGLGVPVGPDEVFRFSNANAVKARINAIFSEMAKGMEAVVYNGVKSQWNFGDQKAITQTMQGLKGVLSREAFEGISAQKFGATDKALQSFLSRKDAGMGLSDRVWRYTEQFKAEMELALQVGVKGGTSARVLATEMKQYLKEPNKLFRRVRDEFGQLHLSKAAKAYNPGRGVYRSSYKNALRLTRTEINMAYRSAENQRYQSLPFIVGYEVRLSNRHPEVDICDDLKGKYPKDFVFRGWHPQCLCHTVPIFATEAEYDRMEEQLLSGKGITPIEGRNAVKEPPNGFKDWIDRNKARASGWRSQPYFIRDNFAGGMIQGGLLTTLNRDLRIVPLERDRIFITEARKAAPELDLKSMALAQSMGINVTPMNLKSVSRIAEKAANEYGGDYSRVKDIVRNTFVCPESKFKEVFAGIDKNFEVIRRTERLKETDPLGYSGHLLNVKIKGGATGEIQVNTPQMIYGKDSEKSARAILGDDLFEKIKRKSGLEPGLGHDYYEQWRNLNPLIDSDAAKMRVIEKKAIAYYTKIRQISLD